MSDATNFLEGELEAFDRDYSLKELLHGVDMEALAKSLKSLLTQDLKLTDAENNVLMETTNGHNYTIKKVLTHDFDELGYLETNDCEKEKLDAALSFIETIIRSGARYQMASTLHLQAIQEDYRQLQEKHQALEASEHRYRELAKSLEQRVKDQVRTIESAQRQIYQTEKLASIGQLAAGFAHEINTPLGYIKSNLNSAQGYLAKLQEVNQLLSNINELEAFKKAWQENDIPFLIEDMNDIFSESISGAEKIADIIKHLKKFSGVDSEEQTTSDINEVVTEAYEVGIISTPAAVKVELDIHSLPKFSCNGTQLGQVILNMLTNAIQACGEKGVVKISTLNQDQKITITIADTGSGIPKEKLDNIFDPFFTTKDVGQGTGLGLTVANDVITAMGGEIRVKSKVDVGTIFYIDLPIHSEAKEELQQTGID